MITEQLIGSRVELQATKMGIEIPFQDPVL